MKRQRIFDEERDTCWEKYRIPYGMDYICNIVRENEIKDCIHNKSNLPTIDLELLWKKIFDIFTPIEIQIIYFKYFLGYSERKIVEEIDDKKKQPSVNRMINNISKKLSELKHDKEIFG